MKLPADRTFEQIKHHYKVEKAIATRLKKATREERKIIYKTSKYFLPGITVVAVK